MTIKKIAYMTHLQLYDAALIEQNKQEAPTLLIEEYNYLINKAIIQYINLTYARFDLNQQSSDDLRWLQKSAELDIIKQSKLIHPMEEANYACVLPSDYFHVLNCTVHFASKCGNKVFDKCKPINDDSLGGTFAMCRRLTANQLPAIIQNAYFKPSRKRPYFYINTPGESGKVSSEIEILNMLEPCPTDACSTWKEDLYSILNPCCSSDNSNVSGRIMEILCGKNKTHYPDVAFVDYLKLPEIIELTWEQVNGTEDNTPMCEFPDAVAYEIINIFCKLLFEHAGDQRLQTHFAINQTVGEVPKSE